MNAEPGNTTTKPGKRWQTIGAVVMVLGWVAMVVAYQFLPNDFRPVPGQYQRFYGAIATALALLLVGGGILVWGIIDGIRALNK